MALNQHASGLIDITANTFNGNSAKHNHTGNQVPMTSTVGDKSDNQGAGSSSLADNEDDLSTRNGGTVSEESATQAIPAKTNSSDETGDTSYADSNRSTASKMARSDTSRVSSMGVSGSTGDADTTQSGGRSQY